MRPCFLFPKQPFQNIDKNSNKKNKTGFFLTSPTCLSLLLPPSLSLSFSLCMYVCICQSLYLSISSASSHMNIKTGLQYFTLTNKNNLRQKTIASIHLFFFSEWIKLGSNYGNKSDNAGVTKTVWNTPVALWYDGTRGLRYRVMSGLGYPKLCPSPDLHFPLPGHAHVLPLSHVQFFPLRSQDLAPWDMRSLAPRVMHQKQGNTLI